MPLADGSTSDCNRESDDYKAHDVRSFGDRCSIVDVLYMSLWNGCCVGAGIFHTLFCFSDP